MTQSKTKINYSDSKDIVQFITENISIIEVIENYGLGYIKESDSRYKMVCPFHQEKTASLKIYKDTNTYFCYGCGSGRSVIDFMMNYERVSFSDIINRYRGKVDTTSPEAVLGKLQEKFFNVEKIDIHNYVVSIKYRLGIELRELLKKNPDKKELVDSCFLEMDTHFTDIDNLDKDKIDYFYEDILTRIHNGI